MVGGEKEGGTIIVLIFEKMMIMLGMRWKGKRMVLNQRSQMWPSY